MNRSQWKSFCSGALALLLTAPVHAQVQSVLSRMGFQGVLEGVADDSYPMKFEFFRNGTSIRLIAPPSAVQVTGGVFSTGLDLGQFNADDFDGWSVDNFTVTISVDTLKNGTFVDVFPNIPVTAVPVAYSARRARSADGLRNLQVITPAQAQNGFVLTYNSSANQLEWTAKGGGGLAADSVNSSHIVDGSILNNDIAAAAAIDVTKLTSPAGGNLLLTSTSGTRNWTALPTPGQFLTSSATGLAGSGTTLFYDSENNRIGVGKSNPATILDVNGILTATNINTTGFKLGTASNPGYVLTTNAAGDGTWQAVTLPNASVDGTKFAPSITFSSSQILQTSAGNNLNLQTVNGSLIAQSTGTGTVNMTAVSGDVTMSTSSGNVNLNSATGGLNIVSGGASPLVIKNTSSGGIALGTGATNRLIVDSAGEVQITASGKLKAIGPTTTNAVYRNIQIAAFPGNPIISPTANIVVVKGNGTGSSSYSLPLPTCTQADTGRELEFINTNLGTTTTVTFTANTPNGLGTFSETNARVTCYCVEVTAGTTYQWYCR